MLNSDVLEVAIGLVFIYLLLSLVATSAREALEGYLKQRSKGLEAGLVELFDARTQPQLLQAFYDHPLINALYRGDYALPASLTASAAAATATVTAARNVAVKHLPSYIPASSFALAALDLAASALPPAAQPAAAQLAAAAAQAVAPGQPAVQPAAAGAALETAATLTMPQLQAACAALPPGNFGDSMRLAARTCQSLPAVQAYLEAWFNAAMDRVSGLYKRQTQAWVFGLSLLICVVLNVNSVVIAQALAQNQALRAAVAADADGASKNAAFVRAITNDVDATNAINNQVDQIERVEGLPIGWSDNATRRLQGFFPPKPTALQMLVGALELLAGWLVTAFAITLGAPFWFDVLGKIMVVRSTMKPDDKSGVEPSKDATAPTDAGS